MGTQCPSTLRVLLLGKAVLRTRSTALRPFAQLPGGTLKVGSLADRVEVVQLHHHRDAPAVGYGDIPRRVRFQVTDEHDVGEQLQQQALEDPLEAVLMSWKGAPRSHPATADHHHIDAILQPAAFDAGQWRRGRGPARQHGHAVSRRSQRAGRTFGDPLHARQPKRRIAVTDQEYPHYLIPLALRGPATAARSVARAERPRRNQPSRTAAHGG